MKLRRIAASLALILLAVSVAHAGDSPDKKRDKTRKMAFQTLQDLYKTEPTAKGCDPKFRRI